MNFCIIVEGRSDKLHVQPLVGEQATIICTNGTISEDALLALLESYEHLNFITLFDADKNGEKLRKLMRRCYPEATQLVIPAEYIEVAETPTETIKKLLKQTDLSVT
ncbi:MAG: toprim domain-containing protein [Solibacillus sp.]